MTTEEIILSVVTGVGSTVVCWFFAVWMPTYVAAGCFCDEWDFWKVEEDILSKLEGPQTTIGRMSVWKFWKVGVLAFVEFDYKKRNLEGIVVLDSSARNRASGVIHQVGNPGKAVFDLREFYMPTSDQILVVVNRDGFKDYVLARKGTDPTKPKK